jgi:hypothetical protein
MPWLGAARGGLVGIVFVAIGAGGLGELSLAIEQPQKTSMPTKAIFSAAEDISAITSLSRK